MDYLAHGWSADEMCRQHPALRPAEIYAAMGYYFDHKDEIENEMRSEWEQAQGDKAAAKPSPFFLRLHAQGLL
jgi:hypothetical protein